MTLMMVFPLSFIVPNALSHPAIGNTVTRKTPPHPTGDRIIVLWGALCYEYDFCKQSEKAKDRKRAFTA